MAEVIRVPAAAEGEAGNKNRLTSLPGPPKADNPSLGARINKRASESWPFFMLFQESGPGRHCRRHGNAAEVNRRPEPLASPAYRRLSF